MAEKVEVHNVDQVSALKKKNKKRRLKRKVKLFLVLLMFTLVGGYFASPLARVQRVEIIGENYLNEKDIKKASGLSKKDYAILVIPSQVQKRIEKQPFIAKCTVKKKFFHQVIVEIEEQSIIGYIDDGKGLKVIDDQGSVVPVDYRQLNKVQKWISVQNFTDEKILETFASQLAKVPSSTLSLVSEAIFNPVEPYDRQRIQLNMTDGKIVYVRLEHMASELKYYQEILSRQPDARVYDIYGNKVYASGGE